MAIKKVIEIDVEQVKAMGGLDALASSLDNVEKKSKSLRTEYREAQLAVATLGEKYGATSKQAIEASKRAAELADKIGDAKKLTEAFNPDAKFRSVTASLSGVASGFAAYQGALGLVGKESKNLEAQLLKVQSAMALAQGLQGLGEARDSFKQLKAVAIDAFNGIKNAIGATGIGLLVIALGSIYAYWDDIKEAVSGVSAEQKKLNLDSKNNLEQEQKKLATINDQDNVLKLQGKSERQILEYKKQQTNEAIIAAQLNLKNIEITNKEQQKAVEQNYQYLKSYIDFISIPAKFLYETGAKAINGLLDLINKIPGINIKARVDEKFASNAADYVTKLVFDPEAVKKEGEKTVEEQKKVITNLQNQRAGFQLGINDIDKKAAEEAKRIAKEKYDALLKEAEEYFAKAKDAQELYNKEYEENLKAQQERLAKLITPEDEDLNRANKKLAEIDSFKGTISEKMNMLNEYSAFVSQQEFTTDEEKKFYENQALERKKIIHQQELALAADTMGKIAELLGRNSKLGKAFAVGQALMNTYQGITAELATKAITPYEIGLKVANIAFVAATGFKAVKQILATNPMASSGGGASGSTSASGGASATPQFNLVGQSSTNQLTATIAGQQKRPVQTYVVGSQVSSQQALDRNAQATSTFG